MKTISDYDRGRAEERAAVAQMAQEWAQNRAMRAAAMERESALTDVADDLNREARVLRAFEEMLRGLPPTPRRTRADDQS